MKKLFIEARHQGKISLPKDAISLPKRIAVTATVQYAHHIPDIMRGLRMLGKKPRAPLSARGRYPGQVLGCSGPLPIDADCILFIGEGLFHPSLLGSLGIPVFVLDPSGKIRAAENPGAYLRHRMAGLASYHSAERIGILVSTKKGQNRLPKAKLLMKKLEGMGKKAYIFIFDNLDFSQLENFPFIQSWVNTACPRIAIDDYDKFNAPVVNIDDVIS